jgi:hypothetical protein
MSFFGRIAQGAGRAFDYATPGSGTSTLTELGRTMVGDGNTDSNQPIGQTSEAYDGALTMNPDGTLSEYRNGAWNVVGGNGQNVLGATTTPSLGGSGRGGSAPAYSQQDMDYLNNQQSLYERLMSSIDSAETSGMQRLENSETTANNKAKGQRGRAVEDFGVRRTDTERQQGQALDRVGDNSRTLRNSLMRQLGLGASGGSAFMVADSAVARDASKNRAGVQENYGMNFRDLGTAEKRADEDYTTLLDEIKADRRAKEESFKAGILGQRQQNQQALGEIAGERARLQGGNPLQASAGYRSNYLGLQDQIDALPSQYSTDVAARDLKVETPQLRDYIVDRAAIGGGQGKQTQYSPYAQFLQKDDEELAVR